MPIQRGETGRKPPGNKYAKTIGPVAGRQARRAKESMTSSDTDERRHASLTLAHLNRRMAARAGKTKPRKVM